MMDKSVSFAYDFLLFLSGEMFDVERIPTDMFENASLDSSVL
jgi:hypothetical protein